MKTKILGLLAVGLLAGPMVANALTFSFSFDNVDGNVNGTVSGRIFGLQDNQAGQSATSVLIDSYPAGLLGAIDAEATNWDFANSFTVANGTITSAVFAGQNYSSGFASTFILGGFCLIIGNGCYSPILTLDNGANWLGGGVSVRFSAVPEPGSLALLGLGLAGLGLSRRRKAA